MTVIRQRRVSAVGGLVVVLLIAACGGGSGSDGTNGVVEGRVLVSAAASLTNAFAAVGAAFEAANPDVDVLLNVAGSSALREQILEGAPVDVFASASISNMDRVVDAGDVQGAPRIFVRNLLQIVVPAGNPAGVVGLADLAKKGLLIGLCAEAVPCGDFGRQALEKAGVTAAIDTNEPDVRALLTKIEVGELDAGIVYVTDVASSDGGVDGVDIPEAHNVVADYPIAVLTDAPNPVGAAAFVAFVLADEAQAILADHGFLTP